jgi:signal transduction histidine kinase
MGKTLRRWVSAPWRWITSSFRVQMAMAVVLSFFVAVFTVGIGMQLFDAQEPKMDGQPPAGSIAPPDSREEISQSQYGLSLTYGLKLRLRELASELQANPQISSDRWKDISRPPFSWALTDDRGRVLVRVGEMPGDRIDVHAFLQRVESSSRSAGDSSEGEIAAYYPFEMKGEARYLFGVQRLGEMPVHREEHPMRPLLILSASLAAFLVSYIWLTRGKLSQIRDLAKGMDRIAEGDFSFRLKEKGRDELGSLITNINRMADRLEENRERERAWERNRMELITHVSHDLRGPLTSIIGYLQLMRDKPELEKEELLHCGGIALNKSLGLKRMIDDLFEYAKLSHPNVRLHRKRISLTRLLEQLLEECFVLTEEKGVRLQKELPEDPLVLDGDPVLLARLFENLLDNALRHGQGERIRVVAVRSADWAAITVANPAEELDPSLLERFFDTFVTGDASRREGGSGLGLAIAKSVVKLHGGEIGAEQKAGELRIHIRLPLCPCESDEKESGG